MRAALLCLCVLTSAAATALTTGVHAQSTSAQARDHIRAGTRHAERGQWEDALREFEEAYTLEPHPLRLFDVAQARLKTRRFRAAAEAFSALAESTFLSADQSARAREGLALARAKIARLRIVLPADTTDDRATIDGASASTTDPNEVDPGRHVVRLVRAGEVVGETTLDLADGGEARVALAVAPPPPAPPAPPPARTPVLGWLLGGVALAAFGTGTYFTVSGISSYGDLEDSGCTRSRRCAAADVDAARTDVILGDVLLGVGLVTAATAVWLFVQRSSPPVQVARR